MSESVNIIIDADDLASAKVAAAAKNVENNIKAIKTSGEQAKKSTEFFGVIANSLGGSELGAYASQLAGITEKTSQFAEVQKLGGAGALAFKAGLVGVVGVLAFQVGQAIGNVIFQTEKWEKELAKATEQADKLNAAMLELKGFNFGRDKEEISLIRDPAKQEQALVALKSKLEQDIKDKRKSLDDLQKRDKNTFDEDVLGFEYENSADVQKAIADGEKLIELYGKQVEELRRNTDETAKRIQKQKEQNALAEKEKSASEALVAEINLLKGKGTYLSENVRLLTAERDLIKEKQEQDKQAKQEVEQKNKASTEYVKQLREEVELLRASKSERAAIEAGQKTTNPAQAAAAAALIKERDMLKEKQDAAKKAAADKETEAKRIADLKKAELDKLEEERVLLTRGKEAAHALKLEKQGLAKADAERIAAEQSKLDKVSQAVKNSNAPTQINQAFEARLLTRGSGGGDPAQVTANNTAQLLKEQQLANRLLEEANKREMRLRVIRNN